MAINRTSFLSTIGPAKISVDGAECGVVGGVQLKTIIETTEQPCDVRGVVDEHTRIIKSEITFVPAPLIVQSYLDKFFLWRRPIIGWSAFGTLTTDYNLTITPLGWSGTDKSVTFSNVYLKKQASLKCSSSGDAFGPVTYVALGKNNLAWSGTNKFFELISVNTTNSQRTEWSPSGNPFGNYTGAYGSTWPIVHTKDGFVFDTEIGWEEKETDVDGPCDAVMTSFSATCTFTPVAMTAETAAAMLSRFITGKLRGQSLGSLAENLVVTGVGAGALDVTLYKAIASEYPMNWGATTDRCGQFVFRSLATGKSEQCVGFTVRTSESEAPMMGASPDRVRNPLLPPEPEPEIAESTTAKPEPKAKKTA